jgi:hypothetical protein
MINDKMFVCREMFRHACAFSDCADFALQVVCQDKTVTGCNPTPAVVNSAFACEVYLKALLKYYDIPVKKEHRLKELYELLPEKAREWIKLTVTNYYGQWSDWLGRELLENISNAFTDWRYSYESDRLMSIYHGFLTTFRDTLREASCQSFFGKAWEEYSAN